MQQSFFSPRLQSPNRPLCFSTAIILPLLLCARLVDAQQPKATPIQDLPVQQADAMLKAAVAAGDESVAFDALQYHNHPGILEDALRVVVQRHPKSAMPSLIELFIWLNTPDGGPVWTGDEVPYNFKEHRAGSALKLIDEVVAAVDAITLKAIQPPKDHSYPEAQRYLHDVKAWWQANQ